HLLHLGGRDVRRVAAQEIAVPEEFGALEGLEQIAEPELDALAEPEEIHVAPSERHGVLREIRGKYSRLRLVIRIGRGEVAAAGAHVEQQQGTVLLRHAADLGKRGAAEDLGLLARNQRRGACEELEAEKRLALG